MRRRISLAALAGLVAFTLPVQAGQEDFLLMFGAQRIPNNPDYSHSYATFVRATWPGDGPCPRNPTLHAITISWLPANMNIRTCALLPECGQNFGLQETNRWALANQMRISLWGPYRIRPELYAAAYQQAALLGSGQVCYKANDFGHSSDQVSNCIHAVSSIVDGYRLCVVSPGWGEMASFSILRRFEPYITAPCKYPWIGSALGLDAYPIIYRDWESPRSGLLGPAYRLLGGERDLRPTYGPPVP
jgi:hypothetical protein